MIHNFTLVLNLMTLPCQNDAINAMNKCIDGLRNWMITHKLMINDDKTEFLLIGTDRQTDSLYFSAMIIKAMQLVGSCINTKPKYETYA